jgi:predicted Zn finger-like uncharacterized protein
MLTRCPACATGFRITPEQLKARQGKVRCGECQHVFSALDTLIEEPGSAPHRGAPATVPSESPKFELLPEIVEDPTRVNQWDSISSHPVTGPEEEGATDVATAAVLPLDNGFAAKAQTPLLIDDREPSAVSPAPTFLDVFDVGEPAAAKLEPDLHEDEPASQRRWPWIVGSTLAFIALVLQAILHFRVELAVLSPGLRPALETACAQLGCQVDLPRNIELVSIESSDLHPDPAHEKQLTLTTTLKNRAPFAQTWPHLELTLTDATDRPLARRTLAPADYLPKDANISAGFASRREFVASLAIRPDGLAASGYRLYLFYP